MTSARDSTVTFIEHGGDGGRVGAISTGDGGVIRSNVALQKLAGVISRRAGKSPLSRQPTPLNKVPVSINDLRMLWAQWFLAFHDRCNHAIVRQFMVGYNA